MLDPTSERCTAGTLRRAPLTLLAALAACPGEPAGETTLAAATSEVDPVTSGAPTTGTTTQGDAPTTSDGETGATTGSTGAGVSTGEDTSTGEDVALCPLPAAVNAVLDAQGNLLPLLRVDDPEVVAITATATPVLEVRSHTGAPIWSADHGEGGFFGGFDYDDDGWPDLGLARHEDGATPCGQSHVGTSWLTLIDGRDGSVVHETPPEADICWTFPSATYPTIQWGAQPLFGDGPALFLAPLYAKTASLSRWTAGGFGPADLHYPSTANYDNTYTADVLNAWNTGTSFLANSHVANGLVGSFGGETRAVFFTSGRVVQYAEVAAPGERLRADRPFLSGGRTDLAGRNYGIVARDPGAPELVALIAGTSVATLYHDTAAGTMASDPWGGIERHVSVYDTTTNTVLDRFYSTAHDNDDGHQFEGRVAYPHNPFVRMQAGPSRLAYTVYEGGHWVLHVSKPGAPGDAATFRGTALFDIRDLDGDGVDEWIASHTELPEDPDVPGYYYANWRVDVLRWDEATLSLQPVTSDERGLPYPMSAFREPDRSASSGVLQPVAVVQEHCVPAVVLRTADAEFVTMTLPGATPPGCTCAG
jgi:hypothetical protein